MEARIIRAALLAAVLIVSMGASYRTPNFIIQTQDPRLAEQFGKAAEKYRRDLAIAWLGKAMPEWSQPCVITVHVGANLGAGGATTFVFDRGEVFGWRMTIQGSAERILDTVLPHEITHMIFACHFRRPLPRWADEGGATSVEHPGERAKHYKMLVPFLRTNRGIAFNRMFAMTNYPRDIMPLYAQGYTLCEFLFQQGGRRKFLRYLADGMQDNQWSAATKRHYGFNDLGALQNAWLAWVRGGFPRIQSPGGHPGQIAEPEMLAAGGRRSRPEPNLIYRVGNQQRSTSASHNLVPVQGRGHPGSEPGNVAIAEVKPPPTRVSPPEVLPASGWYAVGERPGRRSPPAVVQATSVEPVRTQVAHPQPIEPSRQIILEWGRPQAPVRTHPPGGATLPAIRK